MSLNLSALNWTAGFKYREVVRNKAERELLQGFACPDCEGFYQAVKSWGIDSCGLPTCGHVKGTKANHLVHACC